MKVAALLMLALPALGLAHEANHRSLTASAAAAVKTAGKEVAAAAAAAPEAVVEGAKATGKIDFWGIMKDSAKSHRHSKIVHFPLALGLAGVLFGLLAYKFQSFQSSSRWLLFLAAIASVLAILAGRAEQDGIEGTVARQVLEGHEMQGYIACGMLWLNWLLSFFPSARKWSWVLLLMLGVVLSFTGMLGGALAHMQF
jgi:uncharacterized membrane protein